jgi:hypothetical protein
MWNQPFIPSSLQPVDFENSCLTPLLIESKGKGAVKPMESEMLTVESANRKDVSTARHGVELQHRHFSFIAAVIRDIPDLEQRYAMAQRFGDACSRSNPRFDFGRFMKACGV